MNRTSPRSRMPTIDDLRVKMCYICREEELYNKPCNPPRRWVHPCNCSLVAHERCLLDWIRASENNPDKSTSNILKCAQCGGKYELESDYPAVLKLMDNVKALLSTGGISITLLSSAASIASVGVGLYVVLIGYGEYALEKFIGKEMTTLILGEDIDQWPFHAFFQLPLIPLSLLLCQTKRFRNVLPLTPLMMFWPSFPPNEAPRRERPKNITFSRWLMNTLGLSEAYNINKLPVIRTPAVAHLIFRDTVKDVFLSWPPSPIVFAFGLSVVQKYYAQYMERCRRHVLGAETDDAEEERRGGLREVLQNFHVEMRIEDEDEQVEEAEGRPQEDELEANIGQDALEGNFGEQQPVRNEIGNLEQQNARNDQLQDDNNVRLVLDGVDAVPQQHEQRLEVLNPPRADAPLAGRARQINAAQHVGNPDAAPAENGAENANNANGARMRLRVTGGTIGRAIGGALMIPPFASMAGSILLHLALGSLPHERVNPRAYGNGLSPRTLLRRFLAIRPPHAAPRLAVRQVYSFPDDMGALEALQSGAILAARIILVGTPVWQQSDPVWWRNTLGLGLLFVGKDLVSIWYQYLSRREVRSRRLKNKPFEGIDPRELDLKPQSQYDIVD